MDRSDWKHSLVAWEQPAIAAKLQKCMESRPGVFSSQRTAGLSTATGGHIACLGVFIRVRVATGKLEDLRRPFREDRDLTRSIRRTT